MIRKLLLSYDRTWQMAFLETNGRLIGLHEKLPALLVLAGHRREEAIQSIGYISRQIRDRLYDHPSSTQLFGATDGDPRLRRAESLRRPRFRCGRAASP